MSDEFIEPTKESRRNLLLLVMLGVLAGALLQYWLKPAFLEYVDSLPLCDRLSWLRVWLLGAIFSPPLLALWAIPHSIRLLKFNQTPLPGTWVFRRTPVKRGSMVRLRAYLLLFLSAFALAFPLIGWHLLNSTAIFAPAKRCT